VYTIIYNNNNNTLFTQSNTERTYKLNSISWPYVTVTVTVALNTNNSYPNPISYEQGRNMTFLLVIYFNNICIALKFIFEDLLAVPLSLRGPRLQPILAYGIIRSC
jgi:hypothetical protein